MRPENLFFSESGVVKLGCFGLTTQAECSSRLGVHCDAFHFLSRETFKGKYITKSEVWSFGISLIELAEGRSPYTFWRADSVDSNGVNHQ